jgi:deazaflavin-dependent oxidoreductase (nitroreductase family)
MSDFNEKIIEEFRANAGKVGGPFEGSPLALLTTVGARTGRSRTSPVGYLPDGGRVLVVASNAGAASHPAWYHNLLANPQATVEIGAETYEATAVPATREERDRLFARVVEAAPGYGDYQTMTSRIIPVVAFYRLRREHAVVERLRDELRALLATLGPGDATYDHPDRLRADLDRLASELEVHFDYEEEQLIPVLNSLNSVPWPRPE